VKEALEMATKVFLVLGTVTLLTGCGTMSSSSPSASPDTSAAQRDCALNAGYWNRDANVCEGMLMR
jgi:hypothetical protein